MECLIIGESFFQTFLSLALKYIYSFRISTIYILQWALWPNYRCEKHFFFPLVLLGNLIRYLLIIVQWESVNKHSLIFQHAKQCIDINLLTIVSTAVVHCIAFYISLQNILPKLKSLMGYPLSGWHFVRL